MKILHINTSDRGGAAKACIRLHEGLLNQGIESKVLVLNQYHFHREHIYAFHSEQQSLLQKIKYSILYRLDSYRKQQLLKNKSKDYECFSFPHSIYDLSQHPLVKEADLIHLHWVAGFLDYRSFFKKIKKPLVWTLHDLSPFNGGFHYEKDFLKNQKSFEELDSQIRKEKLKAFGFLDKMTVVNLSEWLHNYSGKSKAFKKFKQKHIPNGIDTQIFKQTLKSEARRILDLPADKKIILFVADSLNNNRKGFKYLIDALQLIQDEDILFTTVGSGHIGNSNLFTNNLGFISEDRLLAVAYSAADICVVPSLEDNFPNTILEAMACGTPVVGFDVGGIPEMINHNVNGLLATALNVEDLADKILFLLENDEMRQEFGFNARKSIEQKYSLKIQTKKYIQIYRESLPLKKQNRLRFNKDLTETFYE